MSFLVEEGIQRTLSLESRGVPSNSARLTARHAYSCLKTARATVLTQKINKNQSISQWIYQTLPCVELIPASISECACIPAKGCKILRSRYPIPKPITGLSGSGIKSVTTLDGAITFDEGDFSTEKYAGGNKYTATKPTYFILKGYLYITIYKNLQTVVIIGLFDDPIEAGLFPSFCDSICAPCTDIYKMDFYIDQDSAKPIIDIAQQECVALFKQMSEDKKANASDDNSISQ